MSENVRDSEMQRDMINLKNEINLVKSLSSPQPQVQS